jgi:integrase
LNAEIIVTVQRFGDRPNLVLVYADPLTGRRKTKSAGTANEKDAWKKAAAWEAELRSDKYCQPSRVTFDAFMARYTAEKLSTLRPKSKDSALAALRQVKRVLDVDRAAKLTASAMSIFQSRLREEGMKPVTIAHNLRHIKAALRWGESIGLIARAPAIEMPKKAKGSQARSRAVTGEEFERMILSVAKVRPHDAAEWKRFLSLLWNTGLRRSEALVLTWHDGPFHLDVSGEFPAFGIQSEGQKSGKGETVPTVPEFTAWLWAAYPDALDRAGRVLKLIDLRTNQRLSEHRVGRIVERIGKKAGVRVGTRIKRDKKTGEESEVPVFAGCHSLRRGFGSTWARRVMPSVLKQLMRHSSIATTEAYYVTLTASSTSAELWRNWGGKAGESHNEVTNPTAGDEPGEVAQDKDSSEDVATIEVV